MSKLAIRVPDAIMRLFSGKTAYEYTVSSWEAGTPTYPQANLHNNVTHGLRKNELIYSCIAKKADTAATPVLRVHRKADGKELPEHPARRLIREPNPFMSDFDFMALTMMMLDLAGRACWEKQRTKAGKVVGLWPLRPDWLKPVLSSTGLPAGYSYEPEGRTQPIPMSYDDVLEFKLWDPLRLYDGLAPVSVAGRVGDVDNAATDFLKLFFEKGGIPPFIFSSKLKLTDAAVSDIRRRLQERYGGYQNWLVPGVVDSDATVQRLGLTFAEMGFETLDARSEARICMIMRVPPILLGAKVGLDRSTFSNYAEARKAWWQDDLTPQYRRIVDELNNDLVIEFGSDAEYRWDFSDVPAFQEDQTAVWTRGIEALKARGISQDEFREMVGYPPLTGKENLLPFAISPAGNPTATLADDAAGAESGKKSLERKADEPPDDDERRKAERALQTDMESYFTRQQGRILDIASS